MLPQGLWALSLSCLAFHCLAAGNSENFDELLTVRSLRDGRVTTRFLFSITQAGATPRVPDTILEEDEPQHYSLFPLSLGQILREYAVTEVHLSLNAGKWDYGSWGMPEDLAVASGAELWAWMGDSDRVSVDERWKGLRNALSGLFCASIGEMNEMRTTSPTYAFRPEGQLPLLSPNRTITYQLRHASLPSEHVCTENLTPFLKLLPCKSLAGIASLLNPHRLFDADWHGMSIHVTWDEHEGVKLQLSVQAVFDPVRLSTQQKRDFSFQSLFDGSISTACSVASNSKVEVALPQGVGYAITPEPLAFRDQIAVYDTSKPVSQPLDISVRYPAEGSFSYPLELCSPLTEFEISRTFVGTTQSSGKLTVSIQNNRADDLQILYVETMPWLVTFYLHTLDLRVDGQKRDELMTRLKYAPPEAHGRPTLLEVELTIPASSTLQVSMEVIRSFLRYTEHPPDAHRGWDMPPAVFVVRNGSDSMTYGERVYTRPVLVDVATPDFSMPYNVIIMSSTLIALIFGSIFNLLTRRFVAIKVGDGNTANGDENELRNECG
ncbi:GPI16 [Sanghuangporus vaninii]